MMSNGKSKPKSLVRRALCVMRNAIRNTHYARRPWMILVLAVISVGVLALLGLLRSAVPHQNAALSTFAVRRGDLTITVTESGSIKARDTIDIKSGVWGQAATIISLVPEGTYITQEDVNNGKILVELDSSSLKERLREEEKGLAGAEARLIEEQENYHIQQNQNESDITAAQLKVRFAMLDFQKYLGETVANKFIERIDQDPNQSGNIASLFTDPNLLLDDSNLGGSASQELKRLTDNITLSKSKLQRAVDKLRWTVELHEKGYVSDTELQADQLDHDSLKIQEEQAEINLALFKRYDFTKAVEQLLSDYKEAKRELERAEARARSRMAQAQARLSNAEEDVVETTEDVQRRKRQVDACIIKAPAPGLVVYSSSSGGGESYRRETAGPIREGGSVYERQTIIQLPNTAEMIAEISVHESSVDKVKPGQRATITVDAFPDENLYGQVLKVAALPDSQRGWLSPDLKVYTTQILIEGSPAGGQGSTQSLRPGMSAKVEILVEQLHDVLFVPVQVVANREGKKLCYVMASDTPQPREVSTGAFNNTFVQIISGLAEGEQVLLNPPRLIEPSAVAKSTEARQRRGGETPGPRAGIAKGEDGVGK